MATIHHDRRPAMGTETQVFLVARNETAAKELFELVAEEIERQEQDLSSYRRDSEISRINRSAGREPVTVDPELFDLLLRCRAWWQRTAGAFDVTIGPLADLWKKARSTGRLPSDDEIEAARALCGWRAVELDRARRRVRIAVAGARLDLGAIGKGTALDTAAARLSAAGARQALVAFRHSGHRALAPPPGREGWPVVVPSPHDGGQPLARVDLEDEALSTSGDTRQYVVVEGRRYGHVIDPKTGRPTARHRQVSVLAPTAEDADVLSTSLFVSGLEANRAVLRERGAAAFVG